MKSFQLLSQETSSCFIASSSCFCRNGNRDYVLLTQSAVVQNASGPEMRIQFSLLHEGFEPTIPTSQLAILTISLWFGHGEVTLGNIADC